MYLELPSKTHYSCCYHKPIRGPKFGTRKRWYQEHGIDIAYLHPPFGARSNIAYYIRSTAGKLESAIEYNNGTIIKAPKYSGETKNNYFYYRLQEMGKLDHGIIGADEFFSRLVVSYVKEYRVMAAGDFFRESIYEFHNERGLHFCSEQIKLFAYIADCIVSHNVHKADNDERRVAKYLDYSLNCL